MWKAGDTFDGNVIKTANNHLHIVLSDPYNSENGESVVLVYMSTYRGACRTEEDSCILDIGDHSYITGRSYLAYSECREVPVAVLDRELQKETIKPRDSLSKEILVKALEGMQKSKFVSRKLKKKTSKLLFDLID